MSLVLTMLTIQCLIGAWDNLWHHEITEALPSKPSARQELLLHAIREFLYAVIFMGIAWFRWEGLWSFAVIGLLAVEIVVTLYDFVIEDKTRRLPRFERILHTVLAINVGAIMAVWAPVLISWSHADSAVAAVDYGIWSWLFTLFSIGVLAWSIRDFYAVLYLGIPDWRRYPLMVGQSPAPRTVLVTGATGFIGRRLTRALIETGDRVIVLTRNAEKAAWMFGPYAEIVSDLVHIDRAKRIDAIVNLAGEPLAKGLWTKARKERFFSSRVGTTQALMALIRRLDVKPDVLISASAVGYYGPRHDEMLIEESVPMPHLLSEICRRWEDAANQAADLGVRICTIRIGFVLGRDGGALPAMSLPVRFGLGAIMGNGRQWMSWIHVEDLISLLRFTLDNEDLSGPLNGVAAEPVSHGDFMRSLGSTLRRPVLLRIPACLLALLTGEFADLFLTGQRVMPAAAQAAGFSFRFPSLPAALADIYSHPSRLNARYSIVHNATITPSTKK